MSLDQTGRIHQQISSAPQDVQRSWRRIGIWVSLVIHGAVLVALSWWYIDHRQQAAAAIAAAAAA
jgi:hypothetical protein